MKGREPPTFPGESWRPWERHFLDYTRAIRASSRRARARRSGATATCFPVRIGRRTPGRDGDDTLPRGQRDRAVVWGQPD